MITNNYPLLRRAGLASAALMTLGSVGLAQNPASGDTQISGQTVTSTINCNADFADEGDTEFLVSVDGKITPPQQQAEFNVCVVLDISTTMGAADLDLSGGAIPPGDLNGDGQANQRIDAAIAALQALVGQLAGEPNVDLSLVAFAKDAAILDLGPGAGQQTWLSDLTTDANTNGIADLQEVITSLDTGGLSTQNVGLFTAYNWEPGTDYTEALTRANEAIALQPAGENNIIIFISDGLPNQPPAFDAPGGPVFVAAAAGTVINTFGIEGQGFTDICAPGTPLRFIADTTGGQCLAANPEDLADAIGGISLSVDIDRIELCVNGNLVATQDGPGLDDMGCKVLSLGDTNILPNMVLGQNLVEGKVYGTDGTIVTASKFVDKTTCTLMLGLHPVSLMVDGIDRLYVDPILTFNVTEASIPTFTIPNMPQIVGLEFYMQVGMHNGPMFPNNPVQMSNGIKVVIGQGWNVYGSATGIWHWVDGSINPGGSFLPRFDVLAM
jgi:hypothetical protein